MNKTATRLLTLAFTLGIGSLLRPAIAQTTYVPAAVTGYTADVIANGQGSVISSTTHTVDRGNSDVRWCFADSTFRTPAGLRPTRALPPSGFFRSITTPGLTYQMGPSAGNNSLRIDGAGSGTLTLTNPQPCSEVMVLATEGNGSTAPKTFTVTFTDGTVQVFTNIVVPDWFGGSITPAILVGSRVNRGNNPVDGIDNPITDPRIYEVRLNLAVANYSKSVQSVSVSKTSTDPVLNIMGISLGSNCLGVPVGGTATASPASVCPSQPVVLGLTGATVSGGITYQWQASTDGGATFTDIAGAVTNAYTVRPTVTTQYRARLTCRLQSSNSAPVTATVLPNTASVFYAQGAPATFCQSGTAPVLVATPAGGRFSSTTGLAIDATTGTINLATSTVGTYTVTYTITTPCPATGTTTVTIAPPATVLTYTCPPFYKNGPNAVPAITPAAGSRFSAPTGLSIDATTGVVNLAASTVGTYTITYATANGCVSTSSFEVNKERVFPNVLTPNGDTKNDVLFGSLTNVTGYHLEVFNRWGRRVFESSNASQGWTAANASGGMYYYLLEYTNCAGARESYKSWLEVVK
ncbi:gliding motility-associated C-terminal domain-containing protein [Hymenobacter sp. BT186]|uniref:Gliding motility-associated C-terminal domain-containing protein n=1 Tax=Hymenobacter telluris TaxID=2816474 RepID=A0A939EU78_9BACT|nr:gliding motility-associated C-terminal domain-containing protein [Hymenobacter telluris]MBO0357066.1 gliding motility-associated C-terminal domain-containing protein [Hymenobacter telluris]MBW3373093.1 gliding motility-associated C-terminal domain-containing protein [Hymenobacter norwichensis]